MAEKIGFYLQTIPAKCIKCWGKNSREGTRRSRIEGSHELTPEPTMVHGSHHDEPRVVAVTAHLSFLKWLL